MPRPEARLRLEVGLGWINIHLLPSAFVRRWLLCRAGRVAWIAQPIWPRHPYRQWRAFV